MIAQLQQEQQHLLNRALALERQCLYQNNTDWQMPAEVREAQRLTTGLHFAHLDDLDEQWFSRYLRFPAGTVPQVRQAIYKAPCCMQIEHMYSQYVSEEVGGSPSGCLTVSVRGGSSVLAVATLSRMSVPDFACLWTASRVLCAMQKISLSQNAHLPRSLPLSAEVLLFKSPTDCAKACFTVLTHALLCTAPSTSRLHSS